MILELVFAAFLIVFVAIVVFGHFVLLTDLWPALGFRLKWPTRRTVADHMKVPAE